MSITWKERQCEISLEGEWVEGLDSGLFEDIKYRPNKYFHPIEEIQIHEEQCKLLYQRDLVSVDGRIPLEQVLQVLQGAIDATQRLAQDQVFYLYPDADAFVLDRRKNLRIGLINVRPSKDRDRTSQEMCVDAFVQLLAAHCPEGHRRIVSYNKPILTLRHLQQVLTRKGSSPLMISLLVLIFLGGVTYGALYQWGPPRVQNYLHVMTTKALTFGKRVLRSGTDEWFEQARQERRQREYSYKPMPLTLIIEPVVKGQPKKFDEFLFRKLSKFLVREFPAEGKPRIRYQLLIPDAAKFPKAHQQWKKICAHAFTRPCSPQSWLLHFPAYPGGWRPLIESLREALREIRSNASKDKVATKGLLTVRYTGMSAMLRLGWKKHTFGRKALRKKKASKKAPKKKKAAPVKAPPRTPAARAKAAPRPNKASPRPAATNKAPVKKAPARKALPRDLLMPPQRPPQARPKLPPKRRTVPSDPRGTPLRVPTPRRSP